MKREILSVKPLVTGCCPGHDTYPDETYNNSRSRHARSRDKKIEHQHARTIHKRQLKQQITSYFLVQDN